MNNDRRKQMLKASQLIAEAKDILDVCADEESDYVENMPENMHGSEKHDKAEDCAFSMQGLCSDLDDIFYQIEELTE